MAKLAVVGLGKLGAPMAAIYSSFGHEVVGVDTWFETVRRVRDGVDHIKEPGYADLLLKYPFHAIHLNAYDQVEGLNDSDVYFIVVPTPSGPDGKFINDYVVEAIQRLGQALRSNKKDWTIVICSTVMPGSCDGPIRQAIIDSSYRIPGIDCGLVYSPEFIALGSVVHDMQNPDMTLLGFERQADIDVVTNIYAQITDNAPFVHLNVKEAELAKIAINSYITMKISFANMIAEIAEEELYGVDADKVCAAIGADSRIGSKYIKPGAPYGGPCFPRDTVAFASISDKADLVVATQKINERQLERMVTRIRNALSSLDADNPSRPEVAIIGTTYKRGTRVEDEAFGRLLADRLRAIGMKVVEWNPGDSTEEVLQAKVYIEALDFGEEKPSGALDSVWIKAWK